MVKRTVFFQILTGVFLLSYGVQSIFAQQTVTGDLFVDYERVLHVQGLLPVHPGSNQPYHHEYVSRVDTLSVHPWQQISLHSSELVSDTDSRVSLYDPEIRTFWRNLQPGGFNNGAVWEGRGLTSSFTSGLYARYRFISAAVRPQIIYNQNRNFSLSRYTFENSSNLSINQRSEFGNPFYNIDLPQRFGNEPFWTFDPGPSYLRADVKGFEFGLSNQNRWWGPSLNYPIILGNNAPGFWHYFLGTRKPKNIYIGHLETTFIWGKLFESDYFDQRSFNDERYITGMTMSFSPKPIPNFTVGFSRIFMRTLPPEGIPVGDLLKVFEAFTKSKVATNRNPGGNDMYDQIFSVFARGVLPESGFELYGEWVRNDHSWDLRDALGEPEHSRGYTVGLQKTFLMPNRNILAINAEIVQLETTKTVNFRPDASIYTHGKVHQGFTQKGQVMGSGTGPGSNSQLLKGKYYFNNGKLSGWFRRTVYNNDHLYRRRAGRDISSQPENLDLPRFWLHNFELGFGSSLVLFLNQWETEFGLELMREFNDDFLYKNDQTHLALNLRLRYRLSTIR